MKRQTLLNIILILILTALYGYIDSKDKQIFQEEEHEKILKLPFHPYFNYGRNNNYGLLTDRS